MQQFAELINVGSAKIFCSFPSSSFGLNIPHGTENGGEKREKFTQDSNSHRFLIYAEKLIADFGNPRIQLFVHLLKMSRVL